MPDNPGTPTTDSPEAQGLATSKAIDILIAFLLASMLAAVYLVDLLSPAVIEPAKHAGLLSPALPSALVEPENPVDAIGNVPIEEEMQVLVDPPDEVTKAKADVIPEVVRQPMGLIDEGRRKANIPIATETPSLPTAPVAKKPLPEVKFFQTRAYARSVAFVVDHSGSMQGGRFERARAELARSIASLQRGQKFFVVFFDDSFVPMFGDRQRASLAKASPAEKNKVIAWLNTISADGGTNPEPALAFAARLHPEVIYLLTDGSFPPLSAALFDELSRQSIVVHTLGFGSQSDEGNLRHIAARTNGTFREISMEDPASALYLASLPEVRAALHGSSPEQRKVAVQVILSRELSLMDELFTLLGGSDIVLGQIVHEALVDLATGTDFGPRQGDNAAELTAAMERWRLWWQWRATEAAVPSKLGSDDANVRWVSVALARQKSLDCPDELIELLDDSLAPISQEARAALVQLARGPDFGPIDSTDTAAVSTALEQWKRWRAEKLRAMADELAAKQEADAAAKLELAQRLYKNNRKDRAMRRFAEIVRDFPQTQAAKEARKVLEP